MTFILPLVQFGISGPIPSRRPQKSAAADIKTQARAAVLLPLLKADEEVRTRSKRSEQRVQGGPCTWAARRGPQPPARRSLAAASRTRHKRFSFASGTPAACDAPQQPLHHASPPQQLSSCVPCTTWTPAAARGAFELQLHALRRAGRSMDRADRPSPTRSPPHAIDQASG